MDTLGMFFCVKKFEDKNLFNSRMKVNEVLFAVVCDDDKFNS